LDLFAPPKLVVSHWYGGSKRTRKVAAPEIRKEHRKASVILCTATSVVFY
jgi:hypothetical protein